MKATLQCFYHLKALSEAIINDDKISPSMELTYCYQKLINELVGSKNKRKFLIDLKYNKLDILNKGKDYIEPNEFKDIISKKNPLFKGIKAIDSKDLILFF